MESCMLPYVKEFFAHLEDENYSSETIYNYRRDLDAFQTFLQIRPTTFWDIDRRTVNAYKAYLGSTRRISPSPKIIGTKPVPNRRLATRSINRMLSSLRSYLKFLEADYGTTPIPSDAVKLLKCEKKPSPVAELPDLVRLIEAPTQVEPDDRVALRNRAFLEVLFATGMRISELVALDRPMIDERGRIYVLGKGKKRRFVYLTQRAQHHLNSYLATRSDRRRALFVPYRGGRNGEKADRLSANYVQSKIKEYRTHLQIAIPTSAHSLRHGFATYLAEEGASPAAIQILLGYESLNSTYRLISASDKFAEGQQQKYHPLATV